MCVCVYGTASWRKRLSQLDIFLSAHALLYIRELRRRQFNVNANHKPNAMNASPTTTLPQYIVDGRGLVFVWNVWIKSKKPTQLYLFGFSLIFRPSLALSLAFVFVSLSLYYLVLSIAAFRVPSNQVEHVIATSTSINSNILEYLCPSGQEVCVCVCTVCWNNCVCVCVSTLKCHHECLQVSMSNVFANSLHCCAHSLHLPQVHRQQHSCHRNTRLMMTIPNYCTFCSVIYKYSHPLSTIQLWCRNVVVVLERAHTHSGQEDLRRASSLMEITRRRREPVVVVMVVVVVRVINNSRLILIKAGAVGGNTISHHFRLVAAI